MFPSWPRLGGSQQKRKRATSNSPDIEMGYECKIEWTGHMFKPWCAWIPIHWVDVSVRRTRLKDGYPTLIGRSRRIAAADTLRRDLG